MLKLPVRLKLRFYAREAFVAPHRVELAGAKRGETQIARVALVIFRHSARVILYPVRDERLESALFAHSRVDRVPRRFLERVE